ncbi:protein pangolin, isoforms A/H/I/S isoform X3 [Belonocnema kinseyi]|uniref:protein pangolin, isoforms A/H/I/S isoform X3 n=1 Tax=Belonocnema kinseyi TaxID=2817044 RepID=UPI00143D631B|nr:protein pangolin, isoforms A/H/I/S isoform X3 [Belonocnema kinseyi]
MPHVNSSGGGGDDLGSEDEVKVFKDEGEEENKTSENLTEEKSSLIDLTESEEKGSLAGGSYATTGKTSARSDLSPVFGKVDPTPHTSSFNMGYLVSPYPYPNGAGGPIPVSMASKMGLAGTHPSGLPFFCPNGDHLTQPPPAHMGIPPYGALDPSKAAAAAGEYWPAVPYSAGTSPHSVHWKRLLAAAASTGLTRAPMYPFSAGQYPYSMLSPEMSQVAASWHTPSMYPMSPTSAGFRSPYPTSLPISGSSLTSDLYRFSPTGLMPPHPGLSPHAHALASHALVSSAPKTEHSNLDLNHRSTIEQKNTSSLSTDNAKTQDTGQQNNPDKKKPHIKKPLNAFMLYMKEMRAKVVAECTLKESAAINQILGRRWHSLSREEQARYYEAARQERHLHQQRYPGWSARDNYGYGSKKKKRKKERSADPTGGNNMKKCRARYGLDQQSQWCKPCSPVEHGAGMGIHASIIHHGVGSSVGAGVGAGGGGGTVAATAAPSNTNAASNASSPQQEPTYVNL